MTNEDWEKASEIFHRALELPKEQRDSFVSRECASSEVAQEVRRLLELNDAAGIFLETPVVEPANFTTTQSSVFNAGQVVAARFRIERLIGRGGMGEVYEAYDSELKESVAIKTLKADLLFNPAMIEQFRKEVLRSRKVAHPNVCRVYDLFTHDLPDGTQVPFFTMQLLHGETMADWIHRSRATPPQIALPILIQMAAALQAAHRAGLVHRDLNPKNVFMELHDSSSPKPIITDFGLAVRSAGATLSTTTSFAFAQAGTPAYMAPEQRRGDPVSPATDVYALGLVACELLSGEKASAGGFTESIPQVPARWATAIRRALRPDPKDRYSDPMDFVAALPIESPRAEPPLRGRFSRRWLVAVPLLLMTIAGFGYLSLRRLTSISGVREASIVVLPFQDNSAQKELVYLRDGLAEELAGTLASYPNLRVAARNSAFRFRDVTTVRDVAKALGVDKVVTGSIGRTEDRIRIAVQLVDAMENRQIWSQIYDRDFRELLAVEGDIIREISRVMRLTLPTTLARPPTDSIEAYDLYLEGRYSWNLRTREGVEKGLEYFDKAIQADSRFALAYTGIGDSYSTLVDYGWMSPRDAFLKTRSALDQALNFDANLAETHASLGRFKNLMEWDQDGAEREFQRALLLKPSLVNAHHWYSNYLMLAGRLDEALREAESARRLDPFSLPAVVFAGWVDYYRRDFNKAIEIGRQAIELSPSSPDGFQLLALSYAASNRKDEALKSCTTAASFTTDEAAGLRYCGLVQSAFPETKAEARRTAERLETHSHDRQAGYLAMIYGSLGDSEKMYQWMDRAASLQDSSLLLANIAPGLDRYRNEGRFREIIRRIGYLK